MSIVSMEGVNVHRFARVPDLKRHTTRTQNCIRTRNSSFLLIPRIGCLHRQNLINQIG